MNRPIAALVTCEHASGEIPIEYRSHFRGAGAALRSHRGLDIGAAAVAQRFAAALAAPLMLGAVSRLVVDLNRSLDHPGLFSEFTRFLDAAERAEIIRRRYAPYRSGVEELIGGAIGAGRAVAHMGIHSFTPKLRSQRRNYEIGLLFDPDRAIEAEFCAAWRSRLGTERPEWRVYFNRPYRGVSDGLTSHLRNRWPTSRYIGVEIEIRNDLISKARAARKIAETLIRSAPPPLRADGATTKPR